MKKSESCSSDSCRLNKVGGQAVLEGVMMKAGKRTVTTCRKDNGEIVVYDSEFESVRKKHKLLNIPILRGVVNFIEMMMLSVKTLNDSADALGIEEEDGKFEKWCKKYLGASATNVIMVIALILGLGLSVFLFMFLPTWTTNAVNWLWDDVLGISEIPETVKAILEGFIKVAIFLTYLILVSLMKDIKRTFMYHGAEHKTIACYEAGDELTPENAMKHKRFHPRCGTSFMFLMIAIGIVAGIFIRNMLPGADAWLISLIKLALLPLTMGVGYEILMLAGKHDNTFTRIISAPGLWVQRITTKEPTEDMLECAIISTKCALRDEVPEFMDFWNERSWEPEHAESTDEDTAAEEIDSTGEGVVLSDEISEDKNPENAAPTEPTADVVENEGKE